MLLTYHNQKTKTATNEQLVKKVVQRFLKTSSIILQTIGPSVATLNILPRLCLL